MKHTECERRQNEPGEWICDRCESLWFGELAKTDWRPSTCALPLDESKPAENAGVDQS